MNDQNGKPHPKFKSIYLLYLLLFAVFIYFAIYHGPHLWNILPLIVIFFCPLMHIFGSRHHGRHGDSEIEYKREEMKKDLEKKDHDKHKGCH